MVIWKVYHIAFVEGEQLKKLQNSLEKRNVPIPAQRGTIFSDDGKVLSAEIKRYLLEIDWKAQGINKTLLKENIDSLSLLLSRNLKDKSPKEYKKYILDIYNGKVSSDRVVKLSNVRVSHTNLKEIKKYPFFNLGRNKTGLLTKEYLYRDKPFGKLASRTIGEVFGSEGKGGSCGLELYYDSLLKGTPGVSVRTKVGNRYIHIEERNAIEGGDVYTTINVEIQDLAEQILQSKLEQLEAENGLLVLMEVKTGEIKAIVNLILCADGTYQENRNIAVSDQIEPGSTFKVASLIAALESGKVKLTDHFYCEKGLWKPFRNFPPITDANRNHGGYETLSVEEIIWNSSNIGIAKMIEKAFGDNPAKFVEALYKMNVNTPIDIHIPGFGKPHIKHPKDEDAHWSGTSLYWMSFGYELEMTAINTLAFYNAIANNGKFISPILVRKTISKEMDTQGEIYETEHYEETSVINPKICSKRTIRSVQEVLRGVVTDGTGKAANSKIVEIAGKTGTAQISQGSYGHSKSKHNVSFCGYFPAKKPKYTGIVIIGTPHIGYASGGTMAGSVFRDLAESIVSNEFIKGE